jgi:cell division protein FtsQ
LAKNRKRKLRTKRSRDWPRLDLPKIAWSHLVTVVVLAVVFMMGHVATTWIMNRPIDSVVINGVFERVSAREIEAALSGFVQTGFLSADLQAMRTGLTDIPWVANASVRRRWPGAIEVSIVEQYPTACWGERGLLNGKGELFVDNVTHAPVELPRLYGPDGSEARVARMYQRIEEQLEQRGMAAVSLRLDSRGAWEFRLNNGINVRLGATTVDRRIERFFQAFDQVLASQAEFVDYIDMRYTNGFAIGWKGRDPHV